MADSTTPNATYNTIGLVLAITSGLFIGVSFIIKKKGLLSANKKHGVAAGEGHEYLKSPLWWAGLILMALGELCNFAAYAFTAALIVTPLGALSVVISAVLSSIILKERLNTQGKIGCGLCIIGAVIIVTHAPAESPVKTINEFMNLVIQPAFLVYVGLVILGTIFLIVYMVPRYGRTHMLVYITICSIVGSVAVVFTQGFGAAIVYSVTTETQFKHWFVYVTMLVVILTQLIEINYLNKALNIFNTAMVTPIYYVIFTSSTIIASAVLFQGFHAKALDTVTVVFGFMVIVAGVMLLQLSKGSADPAEVEIPDINTSIVDEEKIEVSTGEEPGTLAGVPMAVARARTRRKSLRDFERSHSLMVDFEAGPMAMRANPFMTFRRSKLIVEELAHEKRERDFELKAASNRAARRHTVHMGEGGAALAAVEEQQQQQQQVEDAGRVPQARVKYGRMAESGGRLGDDMSIWHRVKTMHGHHDTPSPVLEEEAQPEAGPSERLLEPASTVSTGVSTPVDDKKRLLPASEGKRRSLSEHLFSGPGGSKG